MVSLFVLHTVTDRKGQRRLLFVAQVMVPSLCSSLVSLFLTMHFPFIQPQQDRRCGAETHDLYNEHNHSMARPHGSLATSERVHSHSNELARCR